MLNQQSYLEGAEELLREITKGSPLIVSKQTVPFTGGGPKPIHAVTVSASHTEGRALLFVTYEHESGFWMHAERRDHTRIIPRDWERPILHELADFVRSQLKAELVH